MRGSCYKFSVNTLGWNASKLACEALGSDLAVINSQDEGKALAPRVVYRSWIGLHRESKNKSRWLWVDGSGVSYTHWDHREPNNLNGTEDCTEIYPAYLTPHAGKWNDRTCNVSLHYICEINGKSETIMFTSYFNLLFVF